VESNCKTAFPRVMPEGAFKIGLLAGSTKPDWFSGESNIVLRGRGGKNCCGK